MPALRLAPLLLLCAVGCAFRSRPPAESPPPPPRDADPVALLPTGLEGVIDLDAEQLRDWPTTARLVRDAGGEGRALLASLGFDPFLEADLVALGVSAVGTAQLELTVVARGRLDEGRVVAALARREEGRPESSVYHGTPFWEGSSSALAFVTSRCAVFGSRAEVRRAIDVALGNDEGIRSAAGDAVLRRALGVAPTAKSGRPALIAALRFPSALKARLAEEKLPAELVDWLAAAVAVGDGIDVGVVIGAADGPRAKELLARLRILLEEIKGRPLVRLAGLAPFVDSARFALRDQEVHFAYRLEQRRLDQLIARVERLRQRLLGAEAPAGEARP